ncbi:Chloride channel core [Opitutus terrae PB90-1]|uniref:Chloride channel core n=2 Tax=Opitutus terrae TaxID=107709 RepID=B1ZT36_OPITP|nr:Chloride channel core [Opitutus terrae PB90-1]
MKGVRDPAVQLLQRLIRLLRWRVWIQEKLQPTEWQITLWWAALAGFVGALSSLLFSVLTEGIHELLTGRSDGVVETMRQLPWWACVAVPATGGLLAGATLLLGKRLSQGQSSTDYMEAIAIGSGRIPVRSSLLKSAAALFSIGSGGSIGREGPMVQLAALQASMLGRWRRFSPPQLRLLVACGAASGIASAYNAPIAGSFFVAEIILGTIAMESLGPLAVSAVAAALTVRVLTDAQHLYQVPAFRLDSPWEMLPYVMLGFIEGTLAPWFLRSLRRAEKLFVVTTIPPIARLVLGGMLVGGIAIFFPQVAGNGYTVVLEILNGQVVWLALVGIMIAKWLATASSFGSGAPGGVFTPSLFMGASAGYLFGTAVHSFWPAGAPDPQACALVGMGAFLSAASYAPVMAIIMLFEMTLSYDIILPLMLCNVIAYYTAKGLQGESLYSESLRRKAAETPSAVMPMGKVRDLLKTKPPVVSSTARFAEIARLFLSVRVNNIYVVGEDQRFFGVVSLHDIKPYLGDPDLASLVIANDIMREEFPRIGPDQSLSEALGAFLGHPIERVPVIDPESSRLLGSLSKTDLLLALVEKRQQPTG